MSALQPYTLQEIENRLKEQCFPFSGVTKLGSCEFHFQKPSNHAGIVMHTGSRIRPVLMDKLLVEEQNRFREEDPYADIFIRDMPIRIVARDSRFEYDLNREKETCIYPYGKKKYGMYIWNQHLSLQEKAPALLKHQEFHDLIDIMIRTLLRKYRYALIYDMHTYCYQREGRIDWYEDPNPEINIGTGAVNGRVFKESIRSFMRDLSGIKIGSHPVRVAENQVFLGGYLSRRLSKTWQDNVLVLAIEFKKIFMDEWTGEVYPDILEKLVQGFHKAAGNLNSSSLLSLRNTS